MEVQEGPHNITLIYRGSNTFYLCGWARVINSMREVLILITGAR